jgi:hypothetical protein
VLIVNSWKALGPGATSLKKVPFCARRVAAPSIKISVPSACPPCTRNTDALVPD